MSKTTHLLTVRAEFDAAPSIGAGSVVDIDGQRGALRAGAFYDLFEVERIYEAALETIRSGDLPRTPSDDDAGEYADGALDTAESVRAVTSLTSLHAPNVPVVPPCRAQAEAERLRAENAALREESAGRLFAVETLSDFSVHVTTCLDLVTDGTEMQRLSPDDAAAFKMHLDAAKKISGALRDAETIAEIVAALTPPPPVGEADSPRDDA